MQNNKTKDSTKNKLQDYKASNLSSNKTKLHHNHTNTPKPNKNKTSPHKEDNTASSKQQNKFPLDTHQEKHDLGMQSNTISTQQDKKKDTFFAKECIQKFEFTSSVASVFDDMLERSIPFYYEVIQLSIYFIKQHLGYFPTRDSHAESKHAQTTVDLTMLPKLITIYDLGSSTGNFLLQLDEALKAIKWRKLRLYGIDNSQAMIAHSKLKAQALNSRAQFFCYDLLQYHFQSCNVIVAHYTLQFIRPPQRLRLIKKIYESLENGGIFIFAEKVISEDKELESQMLSCYYNYKAQKGYSQKEIYKKREALENILVPYSTQENIAMLKQAGFNRIEIMFKWVNFALFLAKKD